VKKRGDLVSEKIVITAGPTQEALDPIRFLTNASSGRMGYALARACQKRGAQVTLISGPTALPPPKRVRFIPVISARQMLAQTLRYGLKARWVMGTAAVADWRPAHPLSRKIKKSPGTLSPGQKTVTLSLVPNPDILKTLADRRKGPFPRLVGFALETEHLLSRARLKMKEKSLDMVVANSPAALNKTHLRAWLLKPNEKAYSFRGTKDALAEKILDSL
jgi:phosphopantothenoylcysteine decarboxylase/phosphopantothenate--cysteine ligase